MNAHRAEMLRLAAAHDKANPSIARDLRDAVRFADRSTASDMLRLSCRDNYAEGEMALTYTSDGGNEPTEIANEIQGEHIATPLARMLNAVPLLLTEVKRLRQRLALAMAELQGVPVHLAWRGVLDPCVRCGGAGQIRYGRSCTWRGGMAVCSPCHHRREERRRAENRD